MNLAKTVITTIVLFGLLLLHNINAFGQIDVETLDSAGTPKRSFAVAERVTARVANGGRVPVCYSAASFDNHDLFRGEGLELQQYESGAWQLYRQLRGFIDEPAFEYRLLPPGQEVSREWVSRQGVFRLNFGYYPAQADGTCAQRVGGNPDVAYSEPFTAGATLPPELVPESRSGAGRTSTPPASRDSIQLVRIVRLDGDAPIVIGSRFQVAVRYTRANDHPAFIAPFVDNFADAGCRQELGTSSAHQDYPLTTDSGTLDMEVAWRGGSAARAVGVGATMFVDRQSVGIAEDMTKFCYPIR